MKCWKQGDGFRSDSVVATATLGAKGNGSFVCKITDTDTIYSCDDIEVGRHPTLPPSKACPVLSDQSRHQRRLAGHL